MSASIDRLVITRPDDWHVHLRDGPMLRVVAPATARVFARAIVMTNLRPPVTSAETAKAYRDRMLAAVPADSRFVTLTTQHLKYSRNALLAGGLRPHFYCMPILKREKHREALVAAAISGSPKFFLGTDSAPHARETKECALCGAGCYTAPFALELYAEIFEDAGALDRLEGFASVHGAAFYGLPKNGDTVTLERSAWTVPAQYPASGEAI